MATPTTNSPKQVECRAALEDIKHLTVKVCAIWGTPDLDVFLSRLIMDARDGERKGLPMAVATELLFLAQTNKMRRAIDLGRALSVNAEVAFRRIDEEDQARLKIDPFDDPSVSHDTIVTREGRFHHAADRPPVRSSRNRQALSPGEMLLMLIKWVLWLIVFLLCAQLAWPVLKTLI